MINTTVNVLGLRNGELETEHRYSFIITTASGDIIFQTDKAERERTFIRSSLKPFQAYVSLTHFTVPVPNEALAIIIASHAGTIEQQNWVRHLLEKADCTEDDLHCGAHLPFDKATAEQLICSGQTATPLHHNCSGKHAGMLLACHCQNWDKSNYFAPEHPYQQQLKLLLTSLCSHGSSDNDETFKIASDGCGVPVYAMTLLNMSKLYAALITNPAFNRIASVMAQYPFLIGDTQRVDSLIMSVTKGRILAKVGADGLLLLSNTALKQGCALKLWDGQNALRDKIAVALLNHHGWLSADEALEIKAKRPNLGLKRLNNQQETIGTYKIIY